MKGKMTRKLRVLGVCESFSLHEVSKTGYSPPVLARILSMSLRLFQVLHSALGRSMHPLIGQL